MTLYHASNVEVLDPRIIRSSRMLDFGFGFYTTTSRAQAERFARRVHERRGVGAPIVNVYSFDDSVAFGALDVLHFERPDDAWLDFVAANRTGTYVGRKYDMVYGPVANDDVYRTINAYLGGFADREATIRNLLTRKLSDQLVFASERSLAYLKHVSSEVL